MKTAEDYAHQFRYEGKMGSGRSPDDCLAALFGQAMADARRAALEECMKLASGTKEDGYKLAMKATAEGDTATARYWRGKMEGAAEVERDIMDLLGIDWANGETEVRA